VRHQRKRHKLSRSASHRKALLRNLCKEVIDHERIQTTEAKAKAVKPEVEKLITLAKRGDLHARRQALSALGQDKFVVYKLFEEVAPRYVDRPGGYTRILKLGPRSSDATEMVLLELVYVQMAGVALATIVAYIFVRERLDQMGRDFRPLRLCHGGRRRGAHLRRPVSQGADERGQGALVFKVR